MSRSSASGTANEQHYVGGLVGYQYGGLVANSDATGSATGTILAVGGLVGKLDGNGTVTSAYLTGAVSGPASAGGLIGIKVSGMVTSSYWNTQTSGQTTSAVGTGASTSQMQTQATYTGWDFTNIWLFTAGAYPTLRK